MIVDIVTSNNQSVVILSGTLISYSDEQGLVTITMEKSKVNELAMEEEEELMIANIE